ncbi:MAG: Protease HtpX [Fimbriimonadaceae bacterium]|nr:Protease HtpX [Fimbriimonadaceae bacterium]
MNTLKVGILLTVLTAIFVWVGSALGGAAGAMIALVLAVAMNLGSYWFSDKIVLAMTRAQPIDRGAAPELYAMLERISERAGIPTPRLYLVPDPSPNAFATGRNPEHGVVAVNQGLLDILSPREVEGVVAHEIGHIKHRDSLTMAIVATLAGAIMTVAQFFRFAALFGGSDEEGGNPLVLLVISIVAPLAAVMVQMGISRAREFEADRAAAELVGSSIGLENALIKLHRGVQVIPGHINPGAAHLCIVNPFSGMGGMIAGLFSTHPPIEQRIAKLRELKLAA